MSEIDPDIQMPEEEPKTPENQSSPQPPEKTPDVEAEGTLENMQGLIDHIDSLEKESDAGALKNIETQLPQNREPGEGNTSTAPLAIDSVPVIEKVEQPVAPPDEPVIEKVDPPVAAVAEPAIENVDSSVAPVSEPVIEKVKQLVAPVGTPEIETPASVEDETQSEGAGDFELASLDDDLTLLLEDIDQVVVQAESDTTETSKDENPVGSDDVRETTPEASSAQEEPAPQNDDEDTPDDVVTDPVESLAVGESSGLDIDVDEIVAGAESLEATPPPPPATETGSTKTESIEEDGESSLEADNEAVLAQALNPSPEKPESTPEQATPEQATPEQADPVALVENDTPPDTSDAADPGGVEASTDISSEIDALLSQVKAEPTRNPVVLAPEAISSAPAGEDSELNDLNGELDDLFASALAQPESGEKSESTESPAPAEAIASIPPEPDQSSDVAGEATAAESEESKAKPVQEEQKKEVPPPESKPRSHKPVTPQDMAMRALDEAMADNVAQMIVGDSEALESVLDDIFDEQAILVQNEENFVNDSAQGGIIQADTSIGDADAMSGSPSVAPMETATDIEDVIDEEIAALGSPEIPKEIATTSLTDLPASDQKEADQVAQEQVEQKPVEATNVADATAVEVVPGESQLGPSEGENKWQDRVMAACEIIEPPLVTVLSCLNYPLRKIPDRLRPAVDWLALSLVFWVPIVWVLAMFVVK